MPDPNQPAFLGKIALYFFIGLAPFPLAVVFLPMAEGLTGFAVLCVPFAIGGAATYRGYRASQSFVVRGVFLTLGLFYTLLLLAAIVTVAIHVSA
jgi:hypothetical protein